MPIHRTNLRFTADPKRVIAGFLYFKDPHRSRHICERVAAYTDPEVADRLAAIRAGFDGRHRHLDQAFERNYQRAIEVMHGHDPGFTGDRRQLFGACLTMEYSIQAAALFNPSMVRHPDQSGLKAGDVRFVMSLRATGEGHVSSIDFQTGTVDQAGQIALDPVSRFATVLPRRGEQSLPKAFVAQRLASHKFADLSLLDALPDPIRPADASAVFDKISHSPTPPPHFSDNHRAILDILDLNYDLAADPQTPLSERVIFPTANAERMGMEDLRLVQFTDAGQTWYYGTYTAYDGTHIRTQLLSTTDFTQFEVRTLNGPAIKDKGMALFPEKIGGRYAMIGRQGGESVSIMFSDDLYVWNEYHPLLEPRYPWEIVQMGNCGSPIRTERGWLLLTHGVGPMRRYALGLALLDLNDPSRVLARSQKPVIEPLEREREGYVPNVLYTCGWLDLGELVIIPYAMSDAACGIITARKQDLLDELLTPADS